MTDAPQAGTAHDVDVVLPVHDVRRPVSRAVRSALRGDRADRVRVIVVCHEVAPEAIEPLIDPGDRAKCTLLPFSDGVPSPAGPKNAGLDAASAPYVALLDSDDYYEDGALLGWLELARERGSDVVFPPVRGDVQGAPAYVQIAPIGQVRPVRQELAAVERLAGGPWLAAVSPAVRRAIAVRVVRIHLLGALLWRPLAEQWAPDEVGWLRALLARYRSLVPGVLRPFSRADRQLPERLQDARTPDEVAAGVDRRLRATRPELLAPGIAANLDRESTVRYLVTDHDQMRGSR